ncbi:hypothetical protein W02_40480 [Nitrospira sp. KM1]|nr:hypothetical protein W02_40480 [Nitrospira sp. KM1]
MQNGLFGTRDIDWDLPTKRNYALWYARRNRFSRILLLDDDIRDISASIIKHGNSLLQSFMVCGLFVDEFPDTSVTGHAEIVLGEDVRTFLSGNSLFLRANTDLGFFPKIYNEDWIFMIPHVHAKQVAAAGVIQQEPYDPFVSAALAEFQEPGEVIADGLLALVNACAYDRRFDQDTWRELLGIRRQWLADLKSRVPYERQRVAMGTALCRCQSILEDDCVRFVEDWEKDCETWRSLIRG